MTSKAYTRATRMAATFLAKQSGAEAAATAFGIDPRTIRSWLATVEIPDDQWTAIRDVLLARGAEMAALGKTAGLPAVLTGAGISDRNVRYGQLIARREGRRSGESCDCVLPPGWVPDLHPKPGTPEHERAVWSIAEANMTQSRREFMHALRPLLAYYIDNIDGDAQLNIPEARKATAAALAGVPDAAGDLVGTLQTWIEGLDDESIAARQAHVDAAYTAYREAIQGELRRRAYPEDVAVNDARETPPSDPEPTETAEPVPTPIRRAPVASKPAPMVLDTGWRDDGPWYDLDTGQRRARYR